MSEIRPIRWADDRLLLLDQTRLPAEEVTVEVTGYEAAAAAIREMRVRGAPAIGVTAAYAVAMAAQDIDAGDRQEFLARLERAAGLLRTARPTAVNLGWAVDRMMAVAARTPPDGTSDSAPDIAARLLAEAQEIQRDGRGHQPPHGASSARN